MERGWLNEPKILDALWGTEHGSRSWRLSASGGQLMDRATVISEQKVLFRAKDPYEGFWDLVNPMVKNVCEHPKIKYVRVRGDSLRTSLAPSL
jgi:hypothetical protein